MQSKSKKPATRLTIILTITAFLLLALLIIPTISAALGGGYWGYRSPIDYLENEWVMFTILFLIFFAVIFYTMNKAFKNAGIASLIGAGLSLLISLAIARKGLLWNYGGGEIDAWVLLIALLIGLAFLIRFAAESFGTKGAVITMIGIWILMVVTDPNQYFPYKLLNNSGFMYFYEEWLASFFPGLVILIIVSFVLSYGTRKTVKEVSEMAEKAYVKMRG